MHYSVFTRLCLFIFLSRFASAEEISNPPSNPDLSVSNEPGYSPLSSDSSPLVPSLEDKPNVSPTSEKPSSEVPTPPTNATIPTKKVELEIEGLKPSFEIDNIPSYSPTESNTFPTLPSFSDKPNVTPTEAHPNTPQPPNYSDPTTEGSVNLPDPVNTPTISPQGIPTYNPGASDSLRPTIPDGINKPILIPFQSSPNVPDLQIVPYGYPGTVIYYDSTLVDVGDSLNTSKLELLESGSVVNAEDILNLSSDEADALASLGSDNGDDIRNAIELKKKLVTNDGQNEDKGIKVIKLISEKNLDSNRLLALDSSTLGLVADIGLDSKKASQALSIAEKFDSSNQQSSVVLLQGISKVSQTDSSKLDLFLEAVADTDSSILLNKAESFSKVLNNTELVSSLDSVTTKTGQVINPVSRLIKMNEKLLDEIGTKGNLEDENLKSVVSIISDGFTSKGAEKPSEIQLSDIENIGTDDGSNLGAQIAADLINAESSEELAKEMQEMIPPVLAVNGNLYAAEIEDMLLLLSQLPKSQRRVVDPLDTDDYKIAVRDVFIDNYIELGTSKVSSQSLKGLFDLSNNSAKNLYLTAMSGSSLQDFSNNVDLVIPDELDAVLHIGKVASTAQRSNLRRRQRNIRLAKLGYPHGDDLITAFASNAIKQCHSEGDEIARQAQLDGSSKQDTHNGVFTQFYVSDTEDDYHGLNGDGIGFTVGVDQHISESLTFGICGGISKSSADDSSFSIESDSLFAGVYLNYLCENYYTDVTLDFGQHSIDSERLGLDDLTYFSNSSVNEKAFGVTIGKVIDSNHYVLNPYVSLRYSFIKAGDFYESGGSGAHKIYAQEADSMIGEIGLECAYFDYLPNGNLMIPEVSLSWTNEFNKDSKDLFVELIDSGASYHINGRKVDSGYGNIGIGSTFVGASNKNTYFHYDYLFANENLKSHLLKVGFSFEF